MTISDNVRCKKLAVGYSGGAGTVEMTGGGLTGMTEYWGVHVGSRLYVSHAGNAQFIQSGGAVHVGGDLRLGFGSGGATGTGVYQISGGTLDVGAGLRLGMSSSGTFHIIGDAATINVDGYSQKANSTLDLDFLAGGISTINVDGLVSLAGTLDLHLDPLAGTPYRPFTLISNYGSDPITGTFGNVSEGDEFVVPGFGHLWLTYAGGIGSNDVVLYTPEPTTVTLLAIGVLGLLRRRRTR